MQDNESTKMTPIVCIIGKKNSGKTTLTISLIRELKKRGYRVGAIKHDAHQFEIDKEGKDTWKMTHAGADCVAINSRDKMAIMRTVGDGKEMGLDELIDLLGDFKLDIILVEGYSKSDKPKIELIRKEISDKGRCSENELIAVVSDVDINFNIPKFALGDVSGIADMIEERFL